MVIDEKQNNTTQKQKTIFLFLSIRAFISDLLRTDYIKYLSERYKVVVFLREMEGITDPNKEYFKNDNITYIMMSEPKSKFWILFDTYLRNELIHVFDDNPAVVWRNMRASNPRRLRFRKIVRFLPKNLFKPHFFFFLERIFFPGYKQFKHYVKKYNPSLVLTCVAGWYPHDAYAILCAKKAGIPSVAMNMSWDNLTMYPRHTRPTDYLIVWNKDNKKEAIEVHGYQEKNVFISGVPRFDQYFISSEKELNRETFLKSKGLNPKYKTVLYATQYKSSEFVEAFVEWQKKNMFGEPVNLFVRVHPRDSLSRYEQFIGMPNVHVERIGTKLMQGDTTKGHKVEMDENDIINTKDTLKHTDVCVNMCSTFTLEAIIFDKPVVNIGFIPGYRETLHFIHYQPLLDKEAVRVAQNMDEIKKYVVMYLKNPSLDNAGRKEIIKMKIAPSDGVSYKRSVDFLSQIIEDSKI